LQQKAPERLGAERTLPETNQNNWFPQHKSATLALSRLH